MANKRKITSGKNNIGANVNATPETKEQNTADIFEKYWPKSFASPRRTVFLVAASLLTAAIVFPTASVGGFTAFKISLAELLNLTTPELVSPANYDVACVLWAMTTVLFMGLVHPCLGIGVLLLLRPWLDGYTFFSDNVYFTWSIYLLCFLWLIQVIKGKKRIYAPPQMLLLAALMVVFLVVTRFSYQYFNTYQHLWLWLGYIMLFLLAMNTTRDRTAWGAALTIFLLGVGVEALFSILHFEYLLPHLRKIIQDPVMLQRHFGATTITPEMARRFNVNRAFGSMLFPNALAAYLLLAIPFAFAAIKLWWRDANETLKRKASDIDDGATPMGRAMLLTAAIVFGIGCFVGVFFVAHFPRAYVYEDTIMEMPMYLKTTPLTILAFIAACCTALSLLLVMSRYGLDGFWYLMRFAGACVLAPLLLYTLWITYSRGAYLGLFFSTAWGVFLLFVSVEGLQKFTGLLKSRKKAVSIALLLCFLALMAPAILDAGAASYAQEPPQPVDARTQVHQEGISLTAGDLADPASLRLRFGYWRVTLRIVMGNLLTGVGLGNFAIAYPAYQYIGAGDVREAHNGFLQLFAETGVFGGTLFLAFWAYFGFWGAWRIINEKDRREKLVLTALYAGVIAFCIHAFVDIDFSHPSLVMFVMVFTALFYTRASRLNKAANSESDDDDEAKSHKRRLPVLFHRTVAAFLILLLAASAAAVFRAYAQQLALSRFNFINVSDNGELSKRMRTGQFFIAELTQFEKLQREGKKPKQNPRLVIPLARLFLDDYEAFANACVFYKQSPEKRGRYLKLEPGEIVPEDGLMIVARDAFRIRDAALENIAAWMDELKRVDAMFPHHHELALNIVKWYEMHVDYVFGPAFKDKRPLWIEQYLTWCETLKSRNPYHADVRMFHAQALLRTALFLQNENTEMLIERALAEWQVVLDLTPITAGHKYAFADALSRISDYYQQKDDKAHAEELKQQAAAMRLKAQKMDEKRAQAHLYP